MSDKRTGTEAAVIFLVTLLFWAIIYLACAFFGMILWNALTFTEDIGFRDAWRVTLLAALAKLMFQSEIKVKSS